MKHKVLIIGGGIAGLIAARELTKAGGDFVLLEAKSELGGRVLGVQDSSIASHFHDLGPTWVFPHQHHTQAFLQELGLSIFPQYIEGDALFQPAGQGNTQRMQGAGGALTYRVEGGMTHIIKTLENGIDASKLRTQHVVTAVNYVNGNWQASVQTPQQSLVVEAEHIVMALPPRMMIKHLQSQAWASADLQDQLQNVPTWMAGQAKFVATYSHAFWREQGLSGQAFSQKGPLQEVHDACANDGVPAALFGFIGVSATQRKNYSDQDIAKACVTQLVQLFGEQAGRYTDIYLKDWASDDHCATLADAQEPSRHPHFDQVKFASELKEKQVYLAGSEFSSIDAGYIEGAIHAAQSSVNTLLKRLL